MKKRKRQTLAKIYGISEVNLYSYFVQKIIDYSKTCNAASLHNFYDKLPAGHFEHLASVKWQNGIKIIYLFAVRVIKRVLISVKISQIACVIVEKLKQ